MWTVKIIKWQPSENNWNTWKNRSSFLLTNFLNHDIKKDLNWIISPFQWNYCCVDDHLQGTLKKYGVKSQKLCILITEYFCQRWDGIQYFWPGSHRVPIITKNNILLCTKCITGLTCWSALDPVRHGKCSRWPLRRGKPKRRPAKSSIHHRWPLPGTLSTSSWGPLHSINISFITWFLVPEWFTHVRSLEERRLQSSSRRRPWEKILSFFLSYQFLTIHSFHRAPK